MMHSLDVESSISLKCYYFVRIYIIIMLYLQNRVDVIALFNGKHLDVENLMFATF